MPEHVKTAISPPDPKVDVLGSLRMLCRPFHRVDEL
jgi:hypothetical protein